MSKAIQVIAIRNYNRFLTGTRTLSHKRRFLGKRVKLPFVRRYFKHLLYYALEWPLAQLKMTLRLEIGLIAGEPKGS